MKLTYLLKSITNVYNKLSNFGKILLFTSLLLIIIIFFRTIQNKHMTRIEGYSQNDNFVLKKGNDLYDDFYSEIYDYLVFNVIKDDYEIGTIMNKTGANSKSIVLDVGSGTGHHVGKLSDNNIEAIGIDISPAMIKKSKENYPKEQFLLGDVLDNSKFKYSSFTHILSLYFTLYYIKDKSVFFKNCMNWLMPGGYLIVHIVNREKFDPILPPGNPLYIVSPQKYAKERITKTNIKFDDFNYTSNFDLDTNKNIAFFSEKIKFDNGKTRSQEHILYMEDENTILNIATNAGFIIQGKVDLIHCAYENQYLYILVKPN